MFERHGLNVARQPDNGVNPRPDNRSGWLEGDAPEVIERYIEDEAELQVHLWNPATQLRYRSGRTKAPAR